MIVGNNIYLSDHYVDLLKNCVDLSGDYVDLSDIKLMSRWQVRGIRLLLKQEINLL